MVSHFDVNWMGDFQRPSLFILFRLSSHVFCKCLFFYLWNKYSLCAIWYISWQLKVVSIAWISLTVQYFITQLPLPHRNVRTAISLYNYKFVSFLACFIMLCVCYTYVLIQMYFILCMIFDFIRNLFCNWIGKNYFGADQVFLFKSHSLLLWFNFTNNHDGWLSSRKILLQ